MFFFQSPPQCVLSPDSKGLILNQDQSPHGIGGKRERQDSLVVVHMEFSPKSRPSTLTPCRLGAPCQRPEEAPRHSAPTRKRRGKTGPHLCVCSAPSACPHCRACRACCALLGLGGNPSAPAHKRPGCCALLGLEPSPSPLVFGSQQHLHSRAPADGTGLESSAGGRHMPSHGRAHTAGYSRAWHSAAQRTSSYCAAAWSQLRSWSIPRCCSPLHSQHSTAQHGRSTALLEAQ